MATWGSISLLNSNSPLMEQLNFFYDHMLMILILITVLVSYIMISLFFNHFTKRFSILEKKQTINVNWMNAPIFIWLLFIYPSLMCLSYLNMLESNLLSFNSIEDPELHSHCGPNTLDFKTLFNSPTADNFEYLDINYYSKTVNMKYFKILGTKFCFAHNYSIHKDTAFMYLIMCPEEVNYFKNAMIMHMTNKDLPSSVHEDLGERLNAPTPPPLEEFEEPLSPLSFVDSEEPLSPLSLEDLEEPLSVPTPPPLEDLEEPLSVPLEYQYTPLKVMEFHGVNFQISQVSVNREPGEEGYMTPLEVVVSLGPIESDPNIDMDMEPEPFYPQPGENVDQIILTMYYNQLIDEGNVNHDPIMGNASHGPTEPDAIPDSAKSESNTNNLLHSDSEDEEFETMSKVMNPGKKFKM